jgi:hypothetical protein
MQLRSSASKPLVVTLRRSLRNYKKIDYSGMDSIEEESEYDGTKNILHDDTLYSDPDWLPIEKHATEKHATEKKLATTNHEKNYILTFIKNYIAIFEDVKKQHRPINYSNKYKSKLYYIDIMRVIIELYSTINEHFDSIYSNSSRLATIIRDKANEFAIPLCDIDRKYHLRGNDASLMRNCVRELYIYINKINYVNNE